MEAVEDCVTDRQADTHRGPREASWIFPSMSSCCVTTEGRTYTRIALESRRTSYIVCDVVFFWRACMNRHARSPLLRSRTDTSLCVVEAGHRDETSHPERLGESRTAVRALVALCAPQYLPPFLSPSFVASFPTLFERLPVRACLPVSLPPYLTACLPVSLPPYLPACLSTTHTAPTSSTN